MRCVICKTGTARPADVELRREIAGHVFTAILRGLRCDSCGETFTEGADGERFDYAVADSLAAAGVAAESFRFLRKLAGLRATDLGQLLGVTADTISRWETEKSPIDRSAFALLGLIVRDQETGSTATLDTLRLVGAPKKLGKEVRLKLAS
jgi:putative zinc finger/helix-turn-helix YgiT family protein